MRAFLSVVAVILALGLVFTVDPPSTRTRVAASAEATESLNAVRSIGSRKATSSIAAYPDRGQLLASDDERQVVRSGASTWHPVQVSEEHALRAIAEGGMAIPAPNGESIRLRYERHVEHPDGNWTWIGREDGSAPGTETVVTFGEKAVFGTIRQANGDLRLTTEAGSTWLVETDHSRVDRNRLAVNDDDFVIPAGLPNPTAASVPEPIRAAGGPVEQVVSVSAEEATLSTTVDIAMGFSTGFATRLGGQSQARTRLNFLVDLTNQAYVASGISGRIRLVHSLQVDYADATPNREALYDLTGVDCTTQTNGAYYMADRRVDCTPVTQSAGLQPLTASRDTYGADLLVLVRKFEAPEQANCGTSWVLGGGQNPIDGNSAAFGMAIVSDSSGDTFPDEGATCPDVSLAHQLGHTMGQQHDLVTAMGTDDSDNNGNLLDPEEFGRHAYSFGYSTDGTGSDIATIMSNRRSGQTRYRVFSNPLISSCGGAPCGTADQADNARSMMETMPVVAQFRDTTGRRALRDIDNDGRSDLLWALNDGSHWAYWLMSGATKTSGVGYSVGAGWRVVATGDFQGDGFLDLVWTNGSAMQMWIGSISGFAGASMRSYPTGWTIVGAGDVNADGYADLLWRDDSSTTFSLWLMNGPTIVGSAAYAVPAPWRVLGTGNFNQDNRLDVVWTDGVSMQMWLGTAQGFDGAAMPGYPTGWDLQGVGDFDGDSFDDLIWRHPAVGHVAVWQMSGGTPLAGYGFAASPAWSPISFGDYSGDGRVDIVWTDGQSMQMWLSTGSGFAGESMTGYPTGWNTIRN